MVTTITDLDEFIALVEDNKIERGTKLNLTGQALDAQDAKRLASALKSGKCPDGLMINLMNNSIGDEGATYIIEALANKNCPINLDLIIENNFLSDESAKRIIQLLKSDQCPQGLRLTTGTQFSEKSIKAIVMAMENNTEIVGLNIYAPHLDNWNEMQRKISYRCELNRKQQILSEFLSKNAAQIKLLKLDFKEIAQGESGTPIATLTILLDRVPNDKRANFTYEILSISRGKAVGFDFDEEKISLTSIEGMKSEFVKDLYHILDSHIKRIHMAYARGATAGLFDKQLPKEVGSKIGEFLSIKDAAAVAQTNKAARDTAEEEENRVTKHKKS